MVLSCDASLPSGGSRRARFPALGGTMKALRLPTLVSAVAYLLRFRRPRLSPRSCPPQRSRKLGVLFRARAFAVPVPRFPGFILRGRVWDLSGLQAIHPVPLLRSRTPVEPTCPCLGGHASAAPAIRTAKASAIAHFGANPQLRHLLPYASRVTLPHTCKACFRLAG